MDEDIFEKYLSLFVKQSIFAQSLSTTQLLTFIYLGQLMLSQKSLYHALRCSLYSTLGVKTLHIQSCQTPFLAGEKNHLSLRLFRVNCNQRM